MFDASTGQETWITPQNIQQSLGHFDLDPCAAIKMPYKTADRMVTAEENGLKLDWGKSRVWLNPPYGKQISSFLSKMSNGIALLPCRTDNKWFHELVVPKARGVFFVKGRIRFIQEDLTVGGSPAFASILVGYTDYDIDAILNSGIKGVMMYKENK